MRTGTRPSRRGGFTLIELLVVIAILASMVALTIGIIGSVRVGQQNSTTEGTVKKLQVGLNQLRTAVIDEATSDKNPYLPAVQAWCDNDKDRAKAVLSYLYMKREFPQTFAEVGDINLAGPPLNMPNGPYLRAHTAFADLPSAAGLSEEQQAAILLQKIVAGKANRGTTIDTDGSFAGAEMVVPGTAAKGYKDGFGNFIVYQRFAGSAEINAPPYIRAGAFNNDPLDPRGKLLNWPGVGARASNLLVVLNAGAGMSRLPNGAFDGSNRMLTVISAGANRNEDNSGNGWWSSHVDGWLGGDNVLGFRLAKLGGRGAN